MMKRWYSRDREVVEEESRGFDSYDLRLGDLMRGERATLGKSLLDVERELKIKAGYIAAIENADPDAFDTPGFIPGYVRSYARYLEMDPDRAYATFCAESGFSTAHGMSSAASSARNAERTAPRVPRERRTDDPLLSPNTPFAPESESVLSRIEPGAVGSALVLVALIGAIGYGGWSVLTQVQKVQITPVENTPDVLADLDPLAGAGTETDDPINVNGTERFTVAGGGRLDRLYRPEALDVPVLVARDAPISTLDPARMGTLRPDMAEAAQPALPTTVTEPEEASDPPKPQVVEEPAPGVRMVAVRPAWVRVRAADGTVIFEGVMNGGDSFEVPVTEEPPTLRVGDSGSIYFAVNGKHYGPVGDRGSVTSGVALTSEALTDSYAVADLSRDEDLSRYVAQLDSTDAPAE